MIQHCVTRALMSALFLMFTTLSVHAEIGWRQGVTDLRQIPAPVASSEIVVLGVPHLSQGSKPWCVPTSAAMVLTYFGVQADPADLKQRAENHKPAKDRNTEFTYWADMQVALRSLGQRWRIRDYQNNEAGFRKGMRDVRRSLASGKPVLIEVHLREGHTFVVVGYNDAAEVVYIRDPLLNRNQVRVLTYDDLRRNWHNHRFGAARSALFSNPG